MKVLKSYCEFNQRRYSNPWVAIVDKANGKPDFSEKVGGYTGGYNRGEAGDLYVTEPKEGAVYMFGQKDYRGNNTERNYVKYINGEFVSVDSANLIEALQEEEHKEEAEKPVENKEEPAKNSITPKQACIIAHQIRRETGCSLAEAFKAAYAGNTTDKSDKAVRLPYNK